MEKVPVTNTTKMPIYVGSTMIPAGETRHFDAHLVPAHLRPAQAAEPTPAPAPDSMVELLAKPVKEISAQFADLSEDELQRLSALELGTETPRKTLLSAIDEELLDRAIKAEEAGPAGQ